MPKNSGGYAKLVALAGTGTVDAFCATVVKPGAPRHPHPSTHHPKPNHGNGNGNGKHHGDSTPSPTPSATPSA